MIYFSSVYERDHFPVENAIEGGYTARALGQSIFTEGEDLDELRSNIRDAVGCHFEPAEKKSGTHHVTIPNHDPIKLGTLASILDDISTHHGLPRTELVLLLKI